jgi:hypothetical protein
MSMQLDQEKVPGQSRQSRVSILVGSGPCEGMAKRRAAVRDNNKSPSETPSHLTK